MKLRARFLQLPILFDAQRLADEVLAIPEAAWRPHPKRFAGNDALPLITTGGDPMSDARDGAMGPTPHLLACPYLMQVLEALGATWGRSRLMRLSGNAEVTPHVDTDYYWRDRMRVHVPIVTQPTVRFLCGDEETHMAAGECWVFDTWSLHSVHNDAVRQRIHLVADTVGGEGLLTLIEQGRSLAQPQPAQSQPVWRPRLSPPRPRPAPMLAYESRNTPTIMTPWELRDHLTFLMGEAQRSHPQLAAIGQALNRLRVGWHALWARSGDDEAARPEYAALLAETWARLEPLGVHGVPLANGMALGLCLRALIFEPALGGGGSSMDGETRAAPIKAAPAPAAPVPAASLPTAPTKPPTAAATPPPATRRPSFLAFTRSVEPIPWQVVPTAMALGRDPQFDRPVFIISPPRSGSTLLFETLAAAPGLMTIGGESHALMEAMPAINPATRGWDSNRMTAAEALPGVVGPLRHRFFHALRDRDGAAPGADAARMLEKTPKNALRIPFLAAAFPEAHFIYLHRDPRATLASMIEGWESGRFRTYPALPDWTGPQWSFLLTPGWRDLIGAPLHEIVARQWATTMDILLSDLAALPAGRWLPVSYEAFLAAPQAEIGRLARVMDIGWDRPLGARLPLSRHTVTPPDPDKWRKHEAQIEDTADIWAPHNERAMAAMGTGRVG